MKELTETAPFGLRDLLQFKWAETPADADISLREITERFVTGGMSLGALSRETHESLAMAMNRLGAASNSGEGGEDAKRFKVLSNGDSANSRVKQIASARFGVTVDYLNNANEIEIKMLKQK